MRGVACTRFFLALLVATALARPAAAQNLSGRYAIEGSNLTGVAYTGTAEITQTTDTNCRIVWHYKGSESKGICMVNSDLFTAAYPSGDGVGLLIYRRAGNGILSGVWTEGGGPLGTETLTPMR
jgi:hypothetical protein